MRRRSILISTLSITVLVATVGGVAYTLHARAQEQADEALYPGLRGPVSVVCPGPTYSILTERGGPGDGGSAIRPHNDCTPSFTEQDVRDYVAHGRVFLGFSIQATGQPTVKRVIFLTVADLKRFGLQDVGLGGYPPAMLVCYVEFSGTFKFLDPFGPPSPVLTPSTLFDAHTGNWLGISVAGPLLA